jgi:hypothetical protein
MKKSLILAALVCAASLAHADGNRNSAVVERPLVAQSLDQFNVEAVNIREQMHSGGTYGYIKNADRARVESRLDQIQTLLQAHVNDGDLPRADKVALANAQEEVNGILRHNDSNRLVCESRAPLGSNIPKTTCRTFGEIEDQRREAQKSVNDFAAAHH